MTVAAHSSMDVLFTREGATYRARVIRSLAGDGQTADFADPRPKFDLADDGPGPGSLRERTQRIEIPPAADARLAGGWLFDAVFKERVGECLRRSLDRARSDHVALPIRLKWADCPELSTVPWEMLYDRAEDYFPALSGHTPVVRYIQMPVQPPVVEVEPPLHILVINSAPADYPPLNLDAEWQQVVGALAELSAGGAVKFTELAEATLPELRRALSLERFHVLHYMGHAGSNPDLGATLAFTNRMGNSQLVTDRDLAVLLRDHDSLQLCVINACRTARGDAQNYRTGIAEKLALGGVPAVVAMQFEITDDAATEFASAFYSALSFGQFVDTAVTEARKAMYAVSLTEWAAPVLYLRADHARLFDIAPQVRSSGTASPGHESRARSSSPTTAQSARDGRAHVIEVSDDTYQDEVIRRSFTVPVILEITAESRGSWTQLESALDRLVHDSAGTWVLARVNLDSAVRLRASLKVDRIPTVVAVIRGQRVDGFSGSSVPEPDLRRWFHRVRETARRLSR